MQDYEEKSAILKALSHPVRLRIVEGLLSKKECNVNKMVKALGLPQSTVSQHLGILRANGIVRVRKQGVKTCYSLYDKRIWALLEALKA